MSHITTVISALLFVATGIALGGCQRQAFNAETRFDDGSVLLDTPRYALVDQARVSTIPRQILEQRRAAIEDGFHAAVQAAGFVHDPDSPQLAAIIYSERFEARRSDPTMVRVDWTLGERTGTYHYQISGQTYPEITERILICDIIRIADGALVRQIVDPSYFELERMATKGEAERVGAAYAFPLRAMAQRSLQQANRRTPEP